MTRVWCSIAVDGVAHSVLNKLWRGTVCVLSAKYTQLRCLRTGAGLKGDIEHMGMKSISQNEGTCNI